MNVPVVLRGAGVPPPAACAEAHAHGPGAPERAARGARGGAMSEEVADRGRDGEEEEGQRRAAVVNNKAPARRDLKRKRGRRPDWIKSERGDGPVRPLSAAAAGDTRPGDAAGAQADAALPSARAFPEGADVLVRSDEAVNGRPYVARVLEMHGEKEATVMWFYRYARTRRPLARLRSGAGERRETDGPPPRGAQTRGHGERRHRVLGREGQGALPRGDGALRIGSPGQD